MTTITIDRPTRNLLQNELLMDASGGLGDLGMILGDPEHAEEAGRLRERIRAAFPLLDALGWEAEDARDEFELPIDPAGVAWIRDRGNQMRHGLRHIDNEFVADELADLATLERLLGQIDEMIGADRPVTDWDARAEIAVGLFIRRHLGADPPPQDAAFAVDLAVWADRLIGRGQAHLVALEAVS